MRHNYWFIKKFDCSDEVVVDLFAGIGYFVLPYLGKHPQIIKLKNFELSSFCSVHAKAKHVYACEWNPTSVEGKLFCIFVIVWSTMELVIPHKLQFSQALNPDVVDLWYFKLWLFHPHRSLSLIFLQFNNLRKLFYIQQKFAACGNWSDPFRFCINCSDVFFSL